MKVGGIFSTFKTTLTGLSTQMKRMEVIAENIANAEKLPDEKGNVYHRKTVVDTNRSGKSGYRFGDQMSLKLRSSRTGHLGSETGSTGVATAKPDYSTAFKVVEVKGEKLIYNPGHPRADEKGYVRMPNVNTVEEMVEMIAASRSYEANISVLNASKQMAKKAMEI